MRHSCALRHTQGVPHTSEEGQQEEEDRIVKGTKRAAGYYEVQEVEFQGVEFGTFYRWSPGGDVVDEYRCGPVLSGLEAPCTLHPWRYGGGREDVGLPFWGDTPI